MTITAKILAFVRQRLRDAKKAPPSDYKSGAVNELKEIEEYIMDEMWNEGEEEG